MEEISRKLVERISSSKGFIKQKIHYTFHSDVLLAQAFTKKSDNTQINNETLETIGDTVLSMCIMIDLKSHRCKKRIHGLFVGLTPDEITNFKSWWTDKYMLSTRISELGLDKLLITDDVNARNSVSVKEDLFEAILGAVFVDSNENMKICRRVCNYMLDIKYDAKYFEENDIQKLQHYIDKNSNVYKLNTKDGKYELLENEKIIKELKGDKNLFQNRIKFSRECLEYLANK